ncbi:hypothetical protein K2P56_04045 [Patescibacteria group bacterium]|nr:hypothetical protein [Patescibacteria group bacterium]
MKINRGAIIFIVVLGGIALIIVGVIAFSNLLKQPSTGTGGGVADLFSSLFPFGQSASRPSENGAETNTPEDLGPVPTLREVSRGPVAGFRVSNAGILYVEQNTGHIFQTPTESLAVTRRANTTFPGLERAVWLSDSAVIFQNIDTEKTENFLVSFATTSVDQQVSSRPLSSFNSVVAEPNLQLMVLTQRAGGTRISVSSYDETRKDTVFTSPMLSWRAFPAGDDVLVETTPSDGLGFLYRILGGGELEKIVGSVPGLMAVPRADGAYIAVSSVSGTSARLSFIDKDGIFAGASPIATFAEKCGWFPGNEPAVACGVPESVAGASIDSWYMGLQTFSDTVWIIRPSSETGTFIKNLETEAGRPIDVIDPHVSPDGRYFIFKNKNDLSLWSLDLTR